LRGDTPVSLDIALTSILRLTCYYYPEPTLQGE
jgi:hypothetical protein